MECAGSLQESIYQNIVLGPRGLTGDCACACIKMDKKKRFRRQIFLSTSCFCQQWSSDTSDANTQNNKKCRRTGCAARSLTKPIALAENASMKHLFDKIFPQQKCFNEAGVRQKFSPTKVPTKVTTKVTNFPTKLPPKPRKQIQKRVEWGTHHAIF